MTSILFRTLPNPHRLARVCRLAVPLAAGCLGGLILAPTAAAAPPWSHVSGTTEIYYDLGPVRIGGDPYIFFNPTGTSVLLEMYNPGASDWTFRIASAQTDGAPILAMRNAAGDVTVELDAQESTEGASFRLWNGSLDQTVTVLGDEGDGGALIRLWANEDRFQCLPAFTPTIELDADAGDGGGRIELRRDNCQATPSVIIDGNEVGAGAISLYDEHNELSLKLDGSQTSTGGGALVSLYNASAQRTIRIDAEDTTGYGTFNMYTPSDIRIVEIDTAPGDTGGRLRLWDGIDDTPKIVLASNYGDTGDSRIITDELEIRGGSDLSENFDIAPAGDVTPQPGMLVCINRDRPGQLRVSDASCDRTVAGVISGAGGVQTGMIMGQAGSIADGAHPVALTGRVYVLCDATRGAIAPGDLLTTSDVAGHAMRVDDHAKAAGAVVGKAMTGLDEGRGLVLVLISLQ